VAWSESVSSEIAAEFEALSRREAEVDLALDDLRHRRAERCRERSRERCQERLAVARAARARLWAKIAAAGCAHCGGTMPPPPKSGRLPVHCSKRCRVLDHHDRDVAAADASPLRRAVGARATSSTARQRVVACDKANRARRAAQVQRREERARRWAEIAEVGCAHCGGPMPAVPPPSGQLPVYCASRCTEQVRRARQLAAADASPLRTGWSQSVVRRHAPTGGEPGASAEQIVRIGAKDK
jgi:hypothetical protein